MVKRLIYLFVALALLCGAKLHLPVLQVVAWAGMVVTYSHDQSLADALAMTFDGDHPCPLCISIRKAQTCESTTITAPVAPERVLLAMDTISGWMPSFSTWRLRFTSPAAQAACPLRPPVPPPRSAV